ncbi:MAG: diaminopimelate epimerase [Myxococcota bacterium]
MRVPFYKYEGAGNDFLVVEKDALSGVDLTPAQAMSLCDRHKGVGGDGVLTVDVASPSMAVINSDGSVPEMCGNGVRCVALHLARVMGATHLELDVETLAGPQTCAVERDGDDGLVTVEMNPASLAPSDIGLRSEEPWIDRALRVEDHDLQLTAVSMGNPHVVIFDAVGDARFALATALQNDPQFANGVNVGFVSELGPDSFRLDVCERGAGWTQACGTGAAAAVTAAVETGRVSAGHSVSVTLPGGTLRITPRETGTPIEMRGPARFVFGGEVTL